MYIFPHNSDWLHEYEKEENRLLATYGEGLVLHHIGSTAIINLHAKDCIDILGIVPDLAVLKLRKSAIVGLGYQCRGEYGIDGREYFVKSERKVHLHIFEEGSEHIDKHLHFIRVMNNSPELVLRLNDLKCELHNKYPDNKDRYQQEKAYFYEEILLTR